jgi:basic amino acid/polyamine antiporter, APA family
MNLRIKSLDDILATAEQKTLHRTLGPFQLTMLGVGAIIGTGIFVLTAEATQLAGPGMMISFIIAGFVCAVCALCYAELASMVPVSGSAYTYSYAVMGELVAWIVGWALILEYAVAASAVSVGWSNYFVGVIDRAFGWHIPIALAKGYFAGGFINVPAVVIGGLVTALLYIGTRESAWVNTTLVVIKIVALTAFCVLAVPIIHMQNFHPFAPLGALGVGGAAASIFFAYVGFDAVSTAAEETKNPQRNVPIGLIASLVICTIFYLVVAAGAIGSVGAQPVVVNGVGLTPGSAEFVATCKQAAYSGTLACSDEPLAHVLAVIGWTKMASVIGLAAFLALPSVILMMLFGQTRIFFVMSRDGLLPAVLSKVHPTFKTPHVVTVITGLFVVVAAAFFPVGELANISNSGTLLAFAMVAIVVMTLRLRDPGRRRSFRTPWIWAVGPLAVVGCVVLFLLLTGAAKMVFVVWASAGLVAYYLYGFRHSHHARDERAAGR